MKYWLVKSEPDEFSIDDLERVGSEPWSGVRNYLARNHLRAMQRGDQVLVYHSSCAVPAVVGIAEVAAEAYPDLLQFDRRSDYHDPKSPPDAPRWSAVDLRFVRRLARPVTLETLKADPRLDGFLLLARGNRLSVLPVTAPQFKRILSHENTSPS
jgi:predicted RNA-binding protein with PUA-like domain